MQDNLRGGMGPWGLGDGGPDSLSASSRALLAWGASPRLPILLSPFLMQWAAEGGLASSRGGPGLQPGRGWAGPGGAGLTVDPELEVLGLLAGGAEGHALVPPLVAQVAAGDPEQLAVLQELDVRVPGPDRPGQRSDGGTQAEARAGAAPGPQRG